MQRLWGRKVSDLGFRTFLTILEWVASKKGKAVVYVDRWFPSSKTCHCCGHVLEKLDLSVRRWQCPSCGSEHDRDENAAINIKRVGASTCGLGEVSWAAACIRCLTPESPRAQRAGSMSMIVLLVNYNSLKRIWSEKWISGNDLGVILPSLTTDLI